jgi:hypothetical protein
MLLRLSGVVKKVKTPLKMFLKMVTHSHLRWYTCGVGTFVEEMVDGHGLWWILE